MEKDDAERSTHLKRMKSGSPDKAAIPASCMEFDSMRVEEQAGMQRSDKLPSLLYAFSEINKNVPAQIFKITYMYIILNYILYQLFRS